MASEEELKMYLNKLVKTIETQSSFEFGNKRIVNKTRIDDILCCIDANIPEELKLFKKHGQSDKHIKSFNIYNSLIANIRIKPIMGDSSYAINYKEVVELAKIINVTFQQDVEYIRKTYPGLFEQ